LKGVDKVKEFISKYKVNAKILKFKETVESVKSASKASGVSEDKILKTLIIIADGKPYVTILPGDKRLNFKQVATILNAKKVRLAKPNEVINITGVKPGEVSPLTEEIKNLSIIVDESVINKDEVLVGGGSLHHLVKVNVKELIRILKPRIAQIGR